MLYIRRKKPDGYKELLVYRRAVELQDYVYKITEKFPIKEHRRREHMRDSSRSVKQNIVEGWKRETTQQYIDFLSYSFGSLGELKEDGEDCIKLKLITDSEFKELTRRCGEVDYLMGRLKISLENKLSKDDFLSPRQRWLEQGIKKERQQQAGSYRELIEKENFIMTSRGLMKKDEAKKLGLEEIEVP